MKRAISGQYVFFTLVSALSGNAVTGASGAISGRKATDGLSGMIVLSGNIIELGGGAYRANLYDFDTSGLQIGYLFTASGCVPVSMHVDTVDSTSGSIFPPANTLTLASGQLSGFQITTRTNLDKSGYTADSISGTTFIAENTPVLVYSGQLSGFQITARTVSDKTGYTVLSGTTHLASGQMTLADVQLWLGKTPYALAGSGYVRASFALHNGAARSGTANTVQLAATAPLGTSGVFDGQVVTIDAGTGAGQSRNIVFYDSSGMATVSPDWITVPSTDSMLIVSPGARIGSGSIFLNPSQTVLVASGSLSGQQVTARTVSDKTDYTVTSGSVVLAAASIFRATFASGVLGVSGGFPILGIGSGSIQPDGSGRVYAVVLDNQDKSGYVVGANLDKTGYTVLSGTTFIASGSITSGVISSGVFVTATTTIASGSLYLASGQAVSLNSGQVVGVYSGNLSGQQVTAQTVGDKTGYTVLSGTTHLAAGTLNSGNFVSGFLTKDVPKDILTWNYSGVPSVSGQRNLLNATRKLINKWDFATSGYLTVYIENDSTLAYTQSLTSASGAASITSLDTTE